MSEAAKTISPAGADRRNTLDVAAIRKDFPILARTVYDKPLVFLDNGASAQKPRAVIDTMVDVMERDYANIHRGVHYLSQRATQLYEEARKKVALFLNAPSENQIVFTGNATEAINLVDAANIAHFLGADAAASPASSSISFMNGGFFTVNKPPFTSRERLPFDHRDPAGSVGSRTRLIVRSLI